jgi:hypothetical protein
VNIVKKNIASAKGTGGLSVRASAQATTPLAIIPAIKEERKFNQSIFHPDFPTS